MSSESGTNSLSVGCECNKWVPVMPSDAGTAVKCVCGRRVEVPLLEEFQGRPALLSATTVEDRIVRLVARGELPIVGRCLSCGDANTTDAAPTLLDCESATVHSSGGFRFLWVPFLFTMTWREEERVEVRGHDTCVPAPICLCKSCQQQLHVQPIPVLSWIAVAVAFIALAGLAGFFNVYAGLGVAVTGLFGIPVAIFIQQFLRHRSRQKTLINLLRQIPVYRQMLTSYPDAIVVFQPDAAPRI